MCVYAEYQKQHCFEDYLCSDKCRIAKLFSWSLLALRYNRFKALVNQTFAKYSQWICQESVLTPQINSRVIKVFTLCCWLHASPAHTAACLPPDKGEHPSVTHEGTPRQTAEPTIATGW